MKFDMRADVNQDKLRWSGTALGVLCALLAGAFWGVSFLAPRALAEIRTEEIVFLRFLFFGCASGLYLIFRKRSGLKISFSQMGEATLLALSGYSFYYLLLASSVREIGVPFATGIVGLLPLTILFASRGFRLPRHHLLGAFLIGVGILIVPLELFSTSYGELLARTPRQRFGGLSCAFAALALWTFFAIRNAQFLKRNPGWSSLEWASRLGVIAGAASTLLFLLGRGPTAAVEAMRDFRLLAWTFFMGVGGSWFATVLWNRASRLLPASLLGQLLVFESVFGLTYGYLYESRWPRVLESISIACLLGGGLLALRGFNSPSDKSNSVENAWA